MKFALYFSALLSLSALAAAPSEAAIRIEFSGTFDNCERDCPGSRVAPLLGTTFSAEIVVPNAGIDRAPEDPTFGGYSFDASEARFTFSSPLSEFNLDGASPVLINVFNCEGDLCNPKDDAVLVFLRAGGLLYDLALGGTWEPKLFSDAIPDVPTLLTLTLRPGFEIWDIASYDASNKMASIQTNPYGAMPSNPRIAISNVPLPAAGWLLASGVVLFRRCIGANREHAHAPAGTGLPARNGLTDL